MTPAPEPLGRLIQEAIASDPGERIEQYRDRLAALGNEVVQPLLTVERQQPALGLFVTAVLETAARKGANEARAGLDVLAALAKELATRTAAREARSRTGGRLVVPQGSVSEAGMSSGNRPRTPDETIQLINAARERRGEPTLDAAEAREVLANLERRKAAPKRYRNVCWKCSAAVDAATNEKCGFCNWLVCWCGGCRAPDYADRVTGERGHCRREVWLATRELDDEVVDVDYRGLPILSAGPPASDETASRSLLMRHGVEAVFHWTPRRNLESILQHGLLSRELLARRRIPIVPHGHGSPEKEKLLRDYVCVSLRPKPWMMDQWSETPVVLELDPESLLADGTLFVPGNSASRLFDADELLTMRGTARLEEIFRGGSAAPQAEAWIPVGVPRIAIRRVHTRDGSTARSVQASALLADLMHDPEVAVTPDMFMASPEPAE